jgi:O-antigen/teichoic acid export membrane protein
MLAELLSSGGPGVAQLSARGAWSAVQAVRDETYTIAGAAIAGLAGGVLLANEGFVKLWTEPELFGGRTLQLLLVLGASVTALTRTDAVNVDAALAFRDRVLHALVVGVLTAAAMLVAGTWWGIVGVASVALAGRSLLFCFMPGIVGRATRQSFTDVVRRSIRVNASIAVTICAAAIVGARVAPADWFRVVVAGAAGACGAFALYVSLLGRRRRANVSTRASRAIHSVARSTGSAS